MSGHERDRDAILARRKIFIASALASLATIHCDKPQPCLSQVPENSGTISEPRACLKIALTPPDAADAPPSADAEPMPCLSQVAPSVDAGRDAGTPPPRPCLGGSKQW